MESTLAIFQSNAPFSDFKLKFGEIIRHVSLTRMHLYTDNDDFAIEEIADAVPHGYVFANSMSVIVVAGKSLRVVFKTHFNHKDAKPIAKRLYGKEEIDDWQSFDVMKEFCNLSAGFLKKICIEQDVPVGISLPVVTLGFNEVFSDMQGLEQKMIFEDCWKLIDTQSTITCSCHVDVFEPKALENLMEYAMTEAEANNDDEYDFL
jgi:CheY-specific phosphatase CheX